MKIIFSSFFLVLSDHPGFPAFPTLTSWPTTELTFLVLLLKQQNKVDKIWNMRSRFLEIYAWLI
jgi:hypothetical protein